MSEQTVKKSDLRTFGLIWAMILLGVDVFPLLFAVEPRVITIVAAAAFAGVALLRPFILRQFYRIWIRLGDFIGGIISKVVMFVVYFAVFTPISLLLKMRGRDLLNQRVDREEKSYWIEREKMAEYIICLIKSPDLVEKIGRAGRQNIIELNNPKKRMEGIFDLLENAYNNTIECLPENQGNR